MLLDNEQHPAGAIAANSLYDDITLVLTDADSVDPDSDTATLSIQIVDDVPKAFVSPVQDVVEGQQLSGVFDFQAGADGRNNFV